MTIDIATARRLLAAATPGPWTASIHHDDDERDDPVEWGDLDGPNGRSVFTVEREEFHALSPENAEFIAASRTLVPALLDEIERMTAIIATYLPHPNGPNATAPGDVDAWNAAMRNLGDLHNEAERLRPLYEAAKSWSTAPPTYERDRRLFAAIDKANESAIATKETT